jgi:hypothetical protein
MSFGKRNGPPASAPAPSFAPRPASSIAFDAEPIAAPVIPQTPVAAYMPLDAYRIGERFEESRARLAARHEEKSQRAKERFAQVEITPYCLIPETFWNGKGGEVLSARLDLFPHEDWNIAFLAADEASAALLDLPVCPDAPSATATEAAAKFIAEADLQLTTGFAGAERARNFSQYAQERDDLRDKLKKLARKVLFALDEEWAKGKLQTAE